MIAAPVVMEPRYSFLSFPTNHPYSFQIPERQVTFNLPVWGEPDLIFAVGCRLIRDYRYLPGPPIIPETCAVHIEEDSRERSKVFPAYVGTGVDSKRPLCPLT